MRTRPAGGPPPPSAGGYAPPVSINRSAWRSSTSPCPRGCPSPRSDLATLRFLDAGESVVLHGPVGVGKSHVAQALGQLACRRGYSVAFLKASRALAHLAGGHADHSWASRLRKLAGPALLMLDDFGMRELTPSQADDLYELITERAGKSTLFTANRAPADWYPLFPNPVVAESLLDRLINTSHVLLMDGPSYRPRKRPARVSPDPQPTASD